MKTKFDWRTIAVVCAGMIASAFLVANAQTVSKSFFRCPYCGQDIGWFDDQAAGQAALQNHLAVCSRAPHAQTPSIGVSPGLNPGQQMMLNTAGQVGNQIGQGLANALFGGNDNAAAAARLEEERRRAAQAAARNLEASVNAQAKVTAEKQAELNAEQAKIADERQQRLMALMKKVGGDSELVPKMGESATLQLKIGTPLFGIPGNPTGELKLKEFGDSASSDQNSSTKLLNAGEQLKSTAATAAGDQDFRKNYDAGTAPYAGGIEPVKLSQPFDPNTLPDSIKSNPNFIPLDTKWKDLVSQQKGLNDKLTQIRQQEAAPGANVPTLQVQEVNIKQALSQNEYDTKLVEKQMQSFTVDMTESPTSPQGSNPR
jgi:hypothetical protein